MPHKIASNSPAYSLPEANLFKLCKVTLTAEIKGEKLLVRLDLKEMTIPEDIDLTARQILRLSINAIRRTLKDYFKDAGSTMEVSVGIIGTKEGNESLKDLAVRYALGE